MSPDFSHPTYRKCSLVYANRTYTEVAFQLKDTVK